MPTYHVLIKDGHGETVRVMQSDDLRRAYKIARGAEVNLAFDHHVEVINSDTGLYAFED